MTLRKFLIASRHRSKPNRPLREPVSCRSTSLEKIRRLRTRGSHVEISNPLSFTRVYAIRLSLLESTGKSEKSWGEESDEKRTLKFLAVGEWGRALTGSSFFSSEKGAVGGKKRVEERGVDELAPWNGGWSKSACEKANERGKPGKRGKGKRRSRERVRLRFRAICGS